MSENVTDFKFIGNENYVYFVDISYLDSNYADLFILLYTFYFMYFTSFKFYFVDTETIVHVLSISANLVQRYFTILFVKKMDLNEKKCCI